MSSRIPGGKPTPGWMPLLYTTKQFELYKVLVSFLCNILSSLLTSSLSAYYLWLSPFVLHHEEFYCSKKCFRERIWKESLVAYLKFLLVHSPAETEEDQKISSGQEGTNTGFEPVI
jgi:hypothetical protein